MQANYPVAVGKRGWGTPTGTFAVTQMDVNPIWRSPWTDRVSTPGPNSPLGVRWIGFWTNGSDRIGFHGDVSCVPYVPWDKSKEQRYRNPHPVIDRESSFPRLRPDAE